MTGVTTETTAMVETETPTTRAVADTKSEMTRSMVAMGIVAAITTTAIEVPIDLVAKVTAEGTTKGSDHLMTMDPTQSGTGVHISDRNSTRGETILAATRRARNLGETPTAAAATAVTEAKMTGSARGPSRAVTVSMVAVVVAKVEVAVASEVDVVVTLTEAAADSELVAVAGKSSSLRTRTRCR